MKNVVCHTYQLVTRNQRRVAVKSGESLLSESVLSSFPNANWYQHCVVSHIPLRNAKSMKRRVWERRIATIQVDIVVLPKRNGYDSFHWTYYAPEIHQIEKLKFLRISRYKFKMRFWFNLNLHWGIRAFRFGGFWGSIFSGNCHTNTVVSHIPMSLANSMKRRGKERRVATIRVGLVVLPKCKWIRTLCGVWHIPMCHGVRKNGWSHTCAWVVSQLLVML